MIPKLKKYSFFAACSRVFNITESAFINTVFPIILPPASHYLGAFGTCTRQSAHGAQTKKRTDFSIPFFNPCWFLYKFNFSFCSKATISERNGDERCRRNDPPQAENPAGRILILCKNNFCIISINLNLTSTFASDESWTCSRIYCISSTFLPFGQEVSLTFNSSTEFLWFRFNNFTVFIIISCIFNIIFISILDQIHPCHNILLFFFDFQLQIYFYNHSNSHKFY